MIIWLVLLQLSLIFDFFFFFCFQQLCLKETLQLLSSSTETAGGQEHIHIYVRHPKRENN